MVVVLSLCPPPLFWAWAKPPLFRRLTQQDTVDIHVLRNKKANKKTHRQMHKTPLFQGPSDKPDRSKHHRQYHRPIGPCTVLHTSRHHSSNASRIPHPASRIPQSSHLLLRCFLLSSQPPKRVPCPTIGPRSAVTLHPPPPLHFHHVLHTGISRLTEALFISPVVFLPPICIEYEGITTHKHTHDAYTSTARLQRLAVRRELCMLHFPQIPFFQIRRV
ncbi:hypothetical protein B0T14DRAFT_104839 [Immersiella caudata]|uniref:Uncharacterized protein n=1 Tax=Immersiella caudata TaxID=314043 RepID=A0AA39X367_9PEZI|nr:hypothetical protein B0T14DRAFT_104839 [Immersiella caudata]